MALATEVRLEKRALRPRRKRVRKALAWCVHFYTALGLVAAAGMAVAIFRGGPDNFRMAFVLMLVATLIDATDGTLARLVKVKEVLPGFDGRKLDDIVDFLTYTCLPLLLLWQAQVLPESYSWCLLIPLLASAYGFSQVSAKTEDGYFLGFPSYWNLVGFYLYLLRPPAWLTLTLLLGFAVLTFVPVRYLYPTQRGKLNRISNGLGGVWAFFLIGILWILPTEADYIDSLHADPFRWLVLMSLFYPVYYLAASWAISLKIWRTASRKKRQLQLSH